MAMGPLSVEFTVFPSHPLAWTDGYFDKKGISLIVGMVLLIPYVLFVPETRGGVILANEAKKLRKSGNPKAFALHEKLGRRNVRQIIRETLLRPLAMLLLEPVVSLFALYDGLNYGVLDVRLRH
jgi:hypothetical protein